jgi:hypothetical protein
VLHVPIIVAQPYGLPTRHDGDFAQVYHPDYGRVLVGRPKVAEDQLELRTSLAHLFSKRYLDQAASQGGWTDDEHADGERFLNTQFIKERNVVGGMLPTTVAQWGKWLDDKRKRLPGIDW